MTAIKIPQKIVLRMSTAISLHDRFTKIAESSLLEEKSHFDTIENSYYDDSDNCLSENNLENRDHYIHQKKTARQRIVLGCPHPTNMQYTNLNEFETPRISVFERLGYPQDRKFYRNRKIRSAQIQGVKFYTPNFYLRSKTSHLRRKLLFGRGGYPRNKTLLNNKIAKRSRINRTRVRKGFFNKNSRRRRQNQQNEITKEQLDKELDDYMKEIEKIDF